MARSIKKGPYVVDSLVRKIETLNRSGEKRVLKTWARRSTILPEFVGPHAGGAQRQQVHPDLRDGEHGRPQARRVRAHAGVPRARTVRRQDPGAGKTPAPAEVGPWKPKRSSGTCASRRASATRCSTLIRGQGVEQAQTTLQFTPKHGAAIVQKVLKSAVANALHEGKVRRRGALREGGRGRRGPDAQALAAARAGAGDAAAQAHQPRVGDAWPTKESL